MYYILNNFHKNFNKFYEFFNSFHDFVGISTIFLQFLWQFQYHSLSFFDIFTIIALINFWPFNNIFRDFCINLILNHILQMHKIIQNNKISWPKNAFFILNFHFFNQSWRYFPYFYDFLNEISDKSASVVKFSYFL